MGALMTTLKRALKRIVRPEIGNPFVLTLTPDCSAVLSALDTLCRKAEQDEYFRIWKDYPLGCGPLTTSIAREAGMSLQTTRRHLIKLEWAGHVNAKRTSGGTTRWWCPPNDKVSHSRE